MHTLFHAVGVVGGGKRKETPQEVGVYQAVYDPPGAAGPSAQVQSFKTGVYVEVNQDVQDQWKQEEEG